MSAVTDVVEIESGLSRAYKQKRKNLFLKGPIPMDQLAAAACLPGSALAILLIIQHRHDITGEPVVTLPTAMLNSFGIDKDKKARGLRELEKAGLIKAHRQPGRSVAVSICSSSGITT